MRHLYYMAEEEGEGGEGGGGDRGRGVFDPVEGEGMVEGGYEGECAGGAGEDVAVGEEAEVFTGVAFGEEDLGAGEGPAVG